MDDIEKAGKIFDELYVAEQKRQMEYTYSLNEWSEKAYIEAQKRQKILEMEAEASERKAKKMADIATKRALKKTILRLQDDGSIRVTQELFGDDSSETAPFRIKEYASLTSYGEDDKVLYISFRTLSGEEKYLFFDMGKLNEKNIQKAFDVLGIEFGFSRNKEHDMREKLIRKLIATAPSWKIPPNYGWYQVEGEWFYALQDKLTLKEVREKCVKI